MIKFIKRAWNKHMDFWRSVQTGEYPTREQERKYVIRCGLLAVFLLTFLILSFGPLKNYVVVRTLYMRIYCTAMILLLTCVIVIRYFLKRDTFVIYYTLWGMQWTAMALVIVTIAILLGADIFRDESRMKATEGFFLFYVCFLTAMTFGSSKLNRKMSRKRQ